MTIPLLRGCDDSRVWHYTRGYFRISLVYQHFRGSPVLAAAAAAMGIASFCISNEVIKQKEEERLAKERAEQERQKLHIEKH